MVQLSRDEQQAISQIEKYFKSRSMTFRDKLFTAMLIAHYELESHNFSNEHERLRILQFTKVLDSLMKKITNNQLNPLHIHQLIPSASDY